MLIMEEIEMEEENIIIKNKQLVGLVIAIFFSGMTWGLFYVGVMFFNITDTIIWPFINGMFLMAITSVIFFIIYVMKGRQENAD